MVNSYLLRAPKSQCASHGLRRMILLTSKATAMIKTAMAEEAKNSMTGIGWSLKKVKALRPLGSRKKCIRRSY